MVGKDYPKYLENNVGESQLPATDKADQYYLPPQTKSFSYEFRSFITGVGNKWVVEIGKMLDDTLKSVDVQKAFGTLAAVDSESAPGTTLVFELQDYKFEDFRAKISLNVKLMKTGTPAFEKNYTKEGKEQGGKMFLGGTFAQKNAVQQSTKLVLDEILRELIADLSGLQ
ncbi:MAG: hypothetical protein FWF12_05930 [Betaproteobacteria bacterium]|nr:hypothetical protein [Betaproteobacteria bacterium]